MGSFSIATSHSTKLDQILASELPPARPVMPVKAPTFKAPKTIGKKPAMIATTDGKLKPLKDKKIKKETSSKNQAPDDLLRQRGKAPDKNGHIVAGGPGSGKHITVSVVGSDQKRAMHTTLMNRGFLDPVYNKRSGVTLYNHPNGGQVTMKYSEGKIAAGKKR